MFEPFDRLTTAPPSRDWGEILFGFVFAAIFIAIGVGASWTLGRMLYDGHRARDWVQVQATVNALGHGTVAYHYEFRDVRYGGQRLGPFPLAMGDNLDSWQESMTSRLNSAYSTGKPITVWIDPHHPEESMVDRNIRWIMVVAMLPFALCFGGLGLAVLWVMLRRAAGTPAYGRDERSPVAARIIVANVFVVAMSLGILAINQSVSKLDWEGIATGVIMLAGAVAVLMWRRKSRPAEIRRPADTKSAAAIARHAAETLERLEQSKRAGAAAAREARQVLAFTPSFMMSDRFPYIVFGLAAAIIIVIGLVILIVGPGHA